jgi:hypothetical protein
MEHIIYQKTYRSDQDRKKRIGALTGRMQSSPGQQRTLYKSVICSRWPGIQMYWKRADMRL